MRRLNQSSVARVLALALATAAIGSSHLFADAPATAPAGPKVTLAYKPVAGSKIEFQFDGTLKGWVSNPNASTTQPGRIEIDAHEHRAGSNQTLAMTDGRVSAAQLQFDPSCDAYHMQDKTKVDDGFALAGKTVNVKIDSADKLTGDVDGLKPPMVMLLQHMLHPDVSYLPTHPVAVGESWTGDSKGFVKQLGLSDDSMGTFKCRLIGISDIDGRRVGDLKIEVDASDGGFNQVHTDIHVAGTMHLDLATGQMVAAKLGVALEYEQQIDRAIDAAGDFLVLGVQTCEVTGTTKLVSGFPPSDQTIAVQKAPTTQEPSLNDTGDYRFVDPESDKPSDK